jgi:hypothetical protein
LAQYKVRASHNRREISQKRRTTGTAHAICGIVVGPGVAAAVLAQPI